MRAQWPDQRTVITPAPSGYRLAERCPITAAAGSTAAPPPAVVAPDHLAACWRSASDADLRARAARRDTRAP